MAGLCRERHGNLRSDGGQAVLSRALAQGGRSIDAVWFGLDRLPAVGGLAARSGDRAEQGLPFAEASVRYLWLDRARRVGRDRGAGGSASGDHLRRASLRNLIPTCTEPSAHRELAQRDRPGLGGAGLVRWQGKPSGICRRVWHADGESGGQAAG